MAASSFRRRFPTGPHFILLAGALLLGCSGPEGSTQVSSAVFLDDPYVLVRHRGRAARGDKLVACAVSERVEHGPISDLLPGLVPGGSFGEGTRVRVQDVEIKASPAEIATLTPSHDGTCVTIETLGIGRLDLTFAGTIGGHRSETSTSLAIVDPVLRGRWVEDVEPLLAGEGVSAFVWGETPDGERVVTAAEEIPPEGGYVALADGDASMLLVRWRATVPSAELSGLVPPRVVQARADRVSATVVANNGRTEIEIEAHAGTRTIRSPMQHEVTVRTPLRCTTALTPGSIIGDSEVSSHRGNFPIRRRENAPDGPCELEIESNLFEQDYTHRVVVELEADSGLAISEPGHTPVAR